MSQMSADYYKVIDKRRFRTTLLQKVLAAATDDVVLMVDTNQRTGPASAENAADALRNAGIEPMVLAIPANPHRMLGISINLQKKRADEKLIVADIGRRILDEETLSALLVYDIALGIGSRIPLPELCERLRTGTPLFGSECFSQSLYDSIVCTSVRSSFDMGGPLKETTDEMGL
jgi:hypothetical protein